MFFAGKIFLFSNFVMFLQLFVELEELTKEGGTLEWKETARWIKFEEDVEVSNRWGKPHVASLSFHSLLELRQALEKGKHRIALSSTNNKLMMIVNIAIIIYSL